MTDADKRSIKSYLTVCLEPTMEYHHKAFEEQDNVKKIASGFEADTAAKMRIYHKAKSEAFESAIADFKELFAEELNLQED